MEKVDKRREKIYAYIRGRISEGSSPTVREICSDLGISSTSTVHSDLKALCSAGLIEMTEGLNRTIRLPGLAAVMVPLLKTATAGTDLLDVQNIAGYISASVRNAKGKELFALRVEGDSMADAAIIGGDIVVVEKTRSAENGQIVVAVIDGEPHIKRYFSEDGHTRLQSENNGMEPVITGEADILGRVLFVQRFY